MKLIFPVIRMMKAASLILSGSIKPKPSSTFLQAEAWRLQVSVSGKSSQTEEEEEEGY